MGTSDLLAQLKAKQAAASGINPPESKQAPPPPPADELLKKLEQSVVSATSSKEEAKVEAEKAKPTKPAKSVKLAYLFVNCFPLGVKVESAEHLIEEAKSIVAATEFKDQQGKPYRVSDYRFIPFGSGPGALLQAFKDIFTKAAPQSITISTDTSEAQIVLGWLSTQADRIVWGR